MTTNTNPAVEHAAHTRGYMVWLIIAWIWVGAPLLWGLSMTIRSSIPLFTSHAGAPHTTTVAPLPGGH